MPSSGPEVSGSDFSRVPCSRLLPVSLHQAHEPVGDEEPVPLVLEPEDVCVPQQLGPQLVAAQPPDAAIPEPLDVGPFLIDRIDQALADEELVVVRIGKATMTIALSI